MYMRRPIYSTYICILACVFKSYFDNHQYTDEGCSHLIKLSWKTNTTRKINAKFRFLNCFFFGLCKIVYLSKSSLWFGMLLVIAALYSRPQQRNTTRVYLFKNTTWYLFPSAWLEIQLKMMTFWLRLISDRRMQNWNMMQMGFSD